MLIQTTTIMKTLLLISAILAISSPISSQPGFENYHTRNEFFMTSPGAMKIGLYGYDNPALLNFTDHFDLMFAWSGEYGSFNRRGLFLGLPSYRFVPQTGFAIVTHTVDDKRITDYRLSTAFGGEAFGVGAGFNLSVRDTEHFNRNHTITLGTIYRPNRYLSLGLTGISVIGFDHYEGVIDVAIRPFGNEKLALFTDYGLRNHMKFSDGYWSSGVAVKALPGIRLTGRYFSFNKFTAGMQFSLGNIGISTQGNFSNNLKHSHNTFAVRVGSYEPNMPDKVRKARNYASIDLSKPMKYQRYQHFDDSYRLLEKLQLIDKVANNDRFGGIAINTSGMNINHTMLWELREQLKEFRKTGKKVIIFIDDAGMNTYHFASVADVIIMHPFGTVNLPGYIKGNIYLGNMLEKVGIGFKEFRFHEYKSGFEILAGDRMSDQDREQHQKMVDGFYNLVKKDIIESRGLTEDKYKRFVNEIFHFSADIAHEYGLVDTLARWTDVNDIIDAYTESEIRFFEGDRLQRFLQRTDYTWGRKPGIAVIYAEGFCGMETGMKARSLAKDIEEAREDNLVKAVVLRVESPGGSTLAMDIIAEELRKTKDEKPVIISQGSVAASGGYWLSMYSDVIVAAPNTITGSIGVIAGWLYDKGIKEKLGYSTDFVKQGEFADLGFGIPLPILNMPLLNREFTEQEEKIISNMMTNTYERFINKIADARGKEYDDVEAISRGRVWLGKDAIEIGLIDTLGSLKTAINIAVEKAGIDIEEGYDIVEYPDQELFSFSGLIAFFVSRMIEVESPEVTKDPLVQYLHFLNKHNSEPLLVLPMEYMNYYFD